MTRKPNKHGGGARTNANGLRFELSTSLDDALRRSGYTVVDYSVYQGDECIGMSVQKNRLYSKFLKPHDIDYKSINSKKWLPDECFINHGSKVAYIIEKKYQMLRGSVDEKLPSCHFKKLEYEKLFRPLGYDVEYIYVFNDWFRKSEYRDTLEYIERMGCSYYFNELPLDALRISR